MMTHDEKRLWLIRYLLEESDGCKGADIPDEEGKQWRMLRSLMNIRPASPATDEFIRIQDSFLQEETRRKGITDIGTLKPWKNGMCLWQGDITTLRCSAIVNAANSGMTGCYHPCHGCIDNAIHTYAGIQLRLECAQIMRRQGHDEETGLAKITKGWNLPAQHVLHTVGPIVLSPEPTEEDRRLLSSCYRSSLTLADENGLESIAFCCISTGEFRFPNEAAARIAFDTAKEYLRDTGSTIRIVFNVFKDEDRRIYERLFREHQEA